MSETLHEKLDRLGFVVCNVVTGKGDYVLQDDSDGRGVYIRHWRSARPCPFPTDFREPVDDPAEQT
jgi:hypothetical protein